jgi:peroxiredoxin family protein
MSEESRNLAILLTSGTLDKIVSACYLAASGVAMGRRVNFFLSWEPLLRLSEGSLGEAPLPATSMLEPTALRAAMQGQPGPDQLLADLRATGLKIFACTATMRMLGLSEKELEGKVDDFSGATAFLALAEDSQVVSF